MAEKYISKITLPDGETYTLKASGEGETEITISDEQPDTKVWINPNTDEIVTVPQINDTTISTTDTWSSSKISQLSNPNLLINPSFSVNQRGFTTLTQPNTQKYFIDRWYCARIKLSNTNNGLSFAWNGTDGSNGWIQQKIEGSTYCFGKEVTISMDIDGVRYSTTIIAPTTINASNTVTIGNLVAGITNHGGNYIALVIYSASTTPAIINNIKLELGSVATPYTPPDPATELAKCQRYYLPLNQYIRYGSSRFISSEIDFTVPIPVTMRSTPTLIGTYTIRNYSNATQDGFTFTITATGANAVGIRATKTGHGLSTAFLEVLNAAFDAEI